MEKKRYPTVVDDTGIHFTKENGEEIYVDRIEISGENRKIVIDDEFARKFDVVLEKKRAFRFKDWVSREGIREFIGKIYHANENVRMHGYQFKQIDMNLKEMKACALAFYKELDKDLYKAIKTVLKSKNTILTEHEPDQKGGENSVGQKERDGRRLIDVNLHPRNTVLGLQAVVHEFAHIATERITKNLDPKIDCIGEIESLFMEKLFADWLQSNGMISAEEQEMMHRVQKCDLRNNSRGMLEEFDFLDMLKSPVTREQLFLAYHAFCERGVQNAAFAVIDRISDGGEFRPRGGHTAEHLFRYVVGGMASVKLYMDFQKDKKTTMARFKNFVFKDATYKGGSGFKEAMFDLTGDEKFVEQLKNADDKSKAE